MKVVAFHGEFASAKMLREDIGNAHWIDQYIDGHNISKILTHLFKDEPLILVGYSLGGSVIGTLTHHLPNIKGAVLYEAPLLDVSYVKGTFPVLWITNRVLFFRKRKLQQSKEAWQKNHPITELRGKGLHIRVEPKKPPIRHNWNQQLNPLIQTWIANLQQSYLLS